MYVFPHSCAILVVQGAEAAPKNFVLLENTWRCSLHLQEGEGSSAGGACSVSVLFMLITKWKKPSRSTGIASPVCCQVKEASSSAL